MELSVFKLFSKMALLYMLIEDYGAHYLRQTAVFRKFIKDN